MVLSSVCLSLFAVESVSICCNFTLAVDRMDAQ
jgi:hypothetical protein